MKKYFLPLLFTLLFCKESSAQILCIYCYDQNARISTGVNNLIMNGSFENGCNANGFFCPNSNSYTCDITDWSCSGGGYATYAHVITFGGLSKIVQGTKAAYFGNDLSHTCSSIVNDTSCLINLGCNVTGIPFGFPNNPYPGYGGSIGVNLEQTVTGLTVGNTYILEFWAGGEHNGFYFINNGLFAVDVGFGHTLLRNKPTPPTVGIGTRYIVEFNATSTSHTIKFTDWGHICLSCTELVLDDVRLYTLAELSPSVPACANGIIDISNIKINIQPNPVTNELTITGTAVNGVAIIYDVTGKEMLRLKTDAAETKINTSNLASGFYVLNYSIGNKTVNVKVMKSGE